MVKKKLKMDKLIEALDIRQRYNSMDFDKFADEYEKWSGKTVIPEEREAWRYIGLNNVDFLLCKRNYGK
jgi:hypothetical protein